MQRYPLKILLSILALESATSFVLPSSRLGEKVVSRTTSRRFSSAAADLVLEEDRVLDAYDQWRSYFNKGDYDSVRYESFKSNLYTLTQANLQARDQAAAMGQPPPEWMNLNQYGDFSHDEYQAMMSGGNDVSQPPLAEEEYSYETGRLDRATLPIQTGDKNSVHGTQVIGTAAERHQGTQVIGTAAERHQGTQVIGTAAERHQGTQVIRPAAERYAGAHQGTQVIRPAAERYAGAHQGTQVIRPAHERYQQGTQVIRPAQERAQKGTQIVRPVEESRSWNQMNHQGTQVIRPAQGARNEINHEANRHSQQRIETHQPGTQVVRQFIEDLNSVHQGERENTQSVPWPNDSNPVQPAAVEPPPPTPQTVVPATSYETNTVPETTTIALQQLQEPEMSLPPPRRATRPVDKGPSAKRKTIMLNEDEVIVDDTMAYHYVEDEGHPGERGTVVIKRPIPENAEPKPALNSVWDHAPPIRNGKPSEHYEWEPQSIFSFYGGEKRPPTEGAAKVRGTIVLAKNGSLPRGGHNGRATILINKREIDGNKPWIASFFGNAKRVTDEAAMRDGRATLIIKKPRDAFATSNSEGEDVAVKAGATPGRQLYSLFGWEDTTNYYVA